MSAPELDFLDISGQRVAYRQLGSGPAVLMIHGWPTHSWLWRDVMPPVAEAGYCPKPRFAIISTERVGRQTGATTATGISHRNERLRHLRESLRALAS